MNDVNQQAFVVIAEFQVKPGNMPAFLEAARDDAKHSVADEPGCQQFDVNCPQGSDDTVVFYEVYDSRADFDAHLETPHLARFRDAFPSLIVEERPVRFATRQYPRAERGGQMNSTTIAVIGTGIMGAPMACRLAEAGFPVTAWNRTSDKSAALQDRGVFTAGNAAEAAGCANVVICMLSSGPVCEALLMGDDGIIAAMRPGSTLLVMSSIPVETAVAVSKAASDRGVDCVDAPVSGGEKGAKDGTLAIMAGGDAPVIDRLRPVFACLGRVTHVGPSGSGALTKLANQLIVASTICAVAEALTLAQSGGADPAWVREALLGGFADSTVFRQHGLRMVEGNFQPGGPAKYQVKDTSTALAFARSRGLTLPVSEEVDRLFQAMVDHGDGDLDHSGVILELQRRNAGGGNSA